MDTVDRMNTIAYDSTLAAVDSLFGFQTQAIRLGETWLKTVTETQKMAADAAKNLLKQSFDAQSLWRTYANDTAKDLNGKFEAAFEPKSNGKVAAK